jgi:regulator of protease activity HflC (stomatin/prohibitin superfamily)
VPVLDAVAYRIDIRVITSTFRAEQTMTRDTVPVDVDAVLFWKVIERNCARDYSYRRSINLINKLSHTEINAGIPPPAAWTQLRLTFSQL